MRKYLIISILAILLISPLKVKARALDDEIIRKSQLCVNDVCNKLVIVDGEYYLVENVKQIILDDSDILSLTTTYTELNYVKIAKPIDYIGYGNYNYRDSFSLEGYRVVTSGSYNNQENIGGVLGYAHANGFWLGVTKEFETMQSVRELLRGKKLTYELISPIQMKINDTYLPSENVNFPNVFDFDISNIFYLLYNSMISMTLFVNSFWTWLTTSKLLNLSLPILGEVWGFEFTPLGVLSGVGLIALITLWLIKRLVPVA